MSISILVPPPSGALGALCVPGARRYNSTAGHWGIAFAERVRGGVRVSEGTPE